MNTDIEDLLISGMHAEVDQVSHPHGIVARAAARHRRQRFRQTAAATVVAGFAASLAIGVSLTGTTPPKSSTPGPATAGSDSAQPLTPQLRLVAALTATGTTSYRMRLHNKAHSDVRSDLDWVYADYTGVYDPAKKIGSGTFRPSAQPGVKALSLRLIGDTFYLKSEQGQWMKQTGSLVDALVLDGGRRWGPTDGASADPQALFRTLKGLGRIRDAGRTGSGAKALDHYTYSYTIPGDDSVAEHTLEGTVQVHHDSNLIAEITQQTTVVGAHPEIADADPLTFSTTISFSDYGVPVEVQAPPDALSRTAR